MKLKNIILSAALLVAFSACDDLFEPTIENHKDAADLENMPSWAVGLLGHAYISNPLGENANSWKFTDVATDDAVSNDIGNSYLKMATGSWRADNNAMDNWQYLRASWQYLNQFLEISENVEWARDKVASDLFKVRFQGDAYGMRALYMYHLLMSCAGWSADGQLLGIPILTESEDINSDFNKPRNTFRECLDQLNRDVEKAIEMLPEEYGDVNGAGDVPSKYTQMGADLSQYNRVFGDHAKNRMSARVARAIRAQAALLAASPAYSEGSGVTWEQAANSMAEILANLGGNPIANIDPTGNKWYEDANGIKNLVAGYNRPEFLWRSNKNESADLEKDQYPPSLFGKGRVNPSQNLVDAFPSLTGYPISDSRSGYDAQNPYANRDPRLALYIIYNGCKAGASSSVITTAADGTNNDAMNKFDGASTRTGYYLRKFLDMNVNANPSNTTNGYHIKPWIRYTEIFLGYAEAANEVWGPQGKGANSYSAYDVIKAIRQRAGIGENGGDPYLESIKGDKDKMRELIRNERRLELCFEGFRFWDLRRWKVDLSKLNETVKGMKITGTNHEVVDVEKRDYKDYMYYGPVPYSEMLKFDALIQNKGW
ncbi:RagB/SusD family nutrient uptake outer membrane protein [Bacteroides oleiciplenus]|uniref:RagB/SusD family nutrient uptake outer membrane protein n=1 Tax=Bacteroides oleiciplenus TaxID=626931 RepID=A0A3E5BCA7_9BACE|nr:RagB/SusD family nutrient uptake outer membrane protein [Bacteroides oleiciplenus]RGN35247.1 RagB/SusD family nutrient uptake outer membrane protein [Bacteroides oleiciplenus]